MKNITILSRISSLTLSFILYVTFLFAYFFNDYHFSVTINDYGEANIEFILLTFFMILITVENIYFYKKLGVLKNEK